MTKVRRTCSFSLYCVEISVCSDWKTAFWGVSAKPRPPLMQENTTAS